MMGGETSSGGASFAPPVFQLQANPAVAGPGQAVVQRQDPDDAGGLNYDSLAEQVYDAIDGLGTNENKVYGALSQVSGNGAGCAAVRSAYQSKYNSNMMDDLRGDFSGDELERVIGYFSSDYTGLAQMLHSAMDGAGTDETAVEACLKLVRGNIPAGQALKRAFKNLYGEDLRDWIRGDFSCGAEEEMLGMFGNEYNDMEHFTELTGRTELGPYEWLKEDRENDLTGSFDTAMENMTRDQAQDILLPFVQVRDYYVWVTRRLDAMGHESRWVKGALYLVDELSDTYDEGVTSGHWFFSPGQDVIPLLEDLNVGIANFAITQFHRLMFGDLKDEPLKGTDAYEFDKQFIEHEQGPVAQSVYSEYDGTGALETIDAMFNGTGFIGNAIDVLSWMGAANGVPTFPDLTQADLTDSNSNYGQDARTHIPLYMLYPDMHRSDGVYPRIDELLDGQGIDPTTGKEDENDVHEDLTDVNKKIMDAEW